MMNENQKKTTEEYRSNWDNIFKKKEKNEQSSTPPPTKDDNGANLAS
jgi:hypothetical protein